MPRTFTRFAYAGPWILVATFVLAWQSTQAHGQTISWDVASAATDCTMAVAGTCRCPGCTEFSRQKREGVAPPLIEEFSPSRVPTPAPTRREMLLPPDSAEGAPSSDALPPAESSPFGTGESSSYGSGISSDDALGALSSTTPGAPDIGQTTGTANQLASAFGGSAGGLGPVSSIGDFFGGGYRLSLLATQAETPRLAAVTIPIAGGDRRRKLADQGSPFPRNQVTFSYNHYRNAVTDVNAVDQHVNRYVFGIERTFLDRMASVELRIPFVGGVRSTQTVGDEDTLGTEFADISSTFKLLLFRSQPLAISTGLTFLVPTSDGATITGPFAQFNQVTFDNGSVHLAPFLAAWYTPSPRLFQQLFVQTDFDAGGYEVTFDNQTRGIIQEQSLLFLDYSVGYWLYQNPCGRLRGVAPMFELHYTTTMQSGDQGPLPGLVLENRRDIMNATGGLHLQLGQSSYLRFAGGAPLREAANREFDAEFAVQYARGY